MVSGFVPTLALTLLHWEDFAKEVSRGVLDSSWGFLLRARAIIEEGVNHLNDDQRMRLENADALIRQRLIPLLREFGLLDYYHNLSANEPGTRWWYYLSE